MNLFVALADVEEPTSKHLVIFVDETIRLLTVIVESEDLFDRVWQKDVVLRSMARDTFRQDVLPAAEKLKYQIGAISPDQLKDHGLVGPAARFKYNVLAKVSKRWRRRNGELTAASTFRRLLEAVDAILDSLIEAAGVGGVTREFKKAIGALAA